MELISRLFGKKEAFIVRESRSERGVFRVLDENGSILFQGSKTGCNFYKDNLMAQMPRRAA